MRVAIIGGAGGMGRWLIRHFTNMGCEVTISDIKVNEAKLVAEEYGVSFCDSNLDAVADADLTVISVPIDKVPKVIDEVKLSLKKGSVLMEISSLKLLVMEKLKEVERFNVQALSIHPLFGPRVEKLTTKKLILIPVSDSKCEEELARRLFPEAKILVLEHEEHDKFMALILSLTYFINVIFAYVISQRNLERFREASGTTFTLQILICEGIFSSDSHLIKNLILENFFGREVIGEFIKASERFYGWIEKRNSDAILEFCQKIKEELMKDKEFSKAYDNMYKALRAIGG